MTHDKRRGFGSQSGMRSLASVHWGVFILSAACSGTSPSAPAPVGSNPAATVAPIDAPDAGEPACLKGSGEELTVAGVRVGSGVVDACLRGDEIVSCLSIHLSDLSARALTPQELDRPTRRQRLASKSAAHVSHDKRQATVRFSDSNTVIAAPLGDGESLLSADVNAAGTIAALIVGTEEKSAVHVFEPRTRKRVATFPASRGDWLCPEVAMLGDTVYVNATNCAGPDAKSWLFTNTGTEVAPVGADPALGTYETRPVQVSAREWAFTVKGFQGSESFTAVVVQDVVTGHVVATIRYPGRADDPNGDTLIRAGDGRLIVIAGSKISVIDPRAKSVVKSLTVPRC